MNKYTTMEYTICIINYTCIIDTELYFSKAFNNSKYFNDISRICDSEEIVKDRFIDIDLSVQSRCNVIQNEYMSINMS